MNLKALFLPIGLIVCGLSGCQAFDWRPILNPGKSEVIQTESGERFYFDLEENATTGYLWSAVSDDDDVEVTVEHKGPEKKQDSAPACGVPGKAVVRIRINRGFDGPAAVTFSLRRPWEGKAAKTFTLSFFKRTGHVAFWERF